MDVCAHGRGEMSDGGEEEVKFACVVGRQVEGEQGDVTEMEHVEDQRRILWVARPDRVPGEVGECPPGVHGQQLGDLEAVIDADHISRRPMGLGDVLCQRHLKRVALYAQGVGDCKWPVLTCACGIREGGGEGGGASSPAGGR